MAKRNFKRIYPTEDEPRYGKRFKILGIQAERIDRTFTDMSDEFCPIEYVPEIDDYVPVFYNVGKNMSEWINNKRKISDSLVHISDNMRTPWKQIIALKVHYFGESEDIIL